MINLDELYLKDLVLITKDYIIKNAPHSDEQFSALMYLTKIGLGISYIVDAKQRTREAIASIVTEQEVTMLRYLGYINLVPNFQLVTQHNVKISLLRIYYLVHSHITLTDLTTIDLVALSKLSLADFKSFISTSSEVKH